MAKTKKSTTNGSSKKTIFNLELVIVILAGALTLMAVAIYVLYQQRESLNDAWFEQQQVNVQQNKQLDDIHAKMMSEEKAEADTTTKIKSY